MSRPEHPVTPTSAAHMPALDGLRGIAVLLVMFMHFAQPYEAAASRGTVLDLAVREAARASWVGVDLFFVLSGFLITGILYDARHREGYFRTFFARRALRILPLYYAFLAIRLWIVPLVDPAGAAATAAIEQRWLWLHLANVRIALTQDWTGAGPYLSHFWSLAVEEQFYVLWPAVVLLLRRHALMLTCIAMIVVAAAVRLWLVRDVGNPVAAYVLLPARMDTLAVGALVALALRGPEAGMLRPVARATLPPAVVIIAVVALGQRGFDLHDAPVQLIGYSAVALLGGAIVALTAAPTHGDRPPRALTSRPLRFFGRYSYALYLIHLPLVPLVTGHVFSQLTVPTLLGSPLPEQLLFMAVAGAVSVALALLSWYVMEKHFLRMKERFAYQPITHPLAASGRAEVT